MTYRAKLGNDAEAAILLAQDPADPTKYVPVKAADNGDGTYSIVTALGLQATSAKQDTVIAALASMLAKQSSDPATQTTLAAVLTKLADPATQTTLAAVLAALEGTLTTELSGSYPSGATPFVSTDDSEANTAKTITIAAAEGKSHYITAIEVAISGAEAASTITVELKEDAGGTPVSKWKEIIGSSAAIGTRVGLALPFPIKLTAGKTADLVISAGGASVVTTGNIAGYTL